jgi:hypothetical protein
MADWLNKPFNCEVDNRYLGKIGGHFKSLHAFEILNFYFYYI